MAERLARLDETIARSREVAHRTPGDSAGNEQLFAAYQQKIAFLAAAVPSRRRSGRMAGKARSARTVEGRAVPADGPRRRVRRPDRRGSPPASGRRRRRPAGRPAGDCRPGEGGPEVVRIDNLLGRIQIRACRPPGRDPHRRREARLDARGARPPARPLHGVRRTARSSLDTRVELGGRERSLPLAGSGVDLDRGRAPPRVAVEAKTFGGDVVRVGPARRRQAGDDGRPHRRVGRPRRRRDAAAAGGQRVAAVEGDVDLDGVEGDMDLRNLARGRASTRASSTGASAPRTCAPGSVRLCDHDRTRLSSWA